MKSSGRLKISFLNDDLTSQKVNERNREIEETISNFKKIKNEALKNQILEAQKQAQNYSSNASSDQGVIKKIN